MWQTILNFIKQIFTLAEKLQQIETTLKEHSRHINELTANQTRFHYELQLQKERTAHEREREAHEREMEALQLERQLLRSRLEQLEKLLPSATTGKKAE